MVTRTWLIVGVIVLILVALAVFAVIALGYRAITQNSKAFSSDFRLEDCTFISEGKNPYFNLQPQYQLVFEGPQSGKDVRVVITVLEDTQAIDLPGIGTIETRVLEEREWAAGQLVEISRNYFALCEQTNSVFYFGEEVDIYKDGKVVGHEGAWRAGENGALPGIIMPGIFLLGARYFQEQAPEVAMDRAEHVATGLQVSVPAGTFSNCVEVLETTALNAVSQSTKRYCPEVGLVFDDGAQLIDFGFDIVKLETTG